MINLKYGMALFTALFLFSSCRTSHVDLRGMSEAERNAYMIKLGKEITKDFGPGYYREYKSPVVLEVDEAEALGALAKNEKDIGRQYCTVLFLYDPERESMEWGYASRILFWMDTGKPIEVIFGNGGSVSFRKKSYKRQRRSKNHKVVPFEYRPPINRFDMLGDE